LSLAVATWVDAPAPGASDIAGVHDMVHLEQLHDLAGRTHPEGPTA
jgi:hypothetical protein